MKAVFDKTAKVIGPGDIVRFHGEEYKIKSIHTVRPEDPGGGRWIKEVLTFHEKMPADVDPTGRTVDFVTSTDQSVLTRICDNCMVAIMEKDDEVPEYYWNPRSYRLMRCDICGEGKWCVPRDGLIKHRPRKGDDDDASG